MKISKDANRNSRQLFRACVDANGRLQDDRVRAVVNHLSQSKPRGYLAILTAFERLVRLDVLKRRAVVESATEITPDLRGQLQADLERKYGSDLDYEFHIKPELIGGLRVQVGSHVWDGSVKAKLETLRTNLS